MSKAFREAFPTLKLEEELEPSSGKAIKRESGVNPGQSRCCKFRATLQTITLCHWNILPGRRLQQKQVRRPAMHTLSLLSRKKR